MTGPEHYREAEKILDKLEDNAEAFTAMAHATLALAAATAMAATQDGDDIHQRAAWREWAGAW